MGLLPEHVAGVVEFDGPFGFPAVAASLVSRHCGF